MREKVLYVFWFEALVNIPTALVCLFLPAAFLSGITGGTEVSKELLEFTRWYGVLLVVLSLILVGALRYGDHQMLKVVLASYLFGDILQIAVTLRWAMVFDWNFAVYASLITSIFYLFCRWLYLRPRRPM